MGDFRVTITTLSGYTNLTSVNPTVSFDKDAASFHVIQSWHSSGYLVVSKLYTFKGFLNSTAKEIVSFSIQCTVCRERMVSDS